MALASAAGAQSLPSEPVTVGGGRVVIGGEAAVGIAARDPGYFNYTDYEHNALRLLRLAVSAELRATDRIWFLGEVLDEISLLADPQSRNRNVLRGYAWYARVRPWAGRRFDIQAGRIPPAFGAFARRRYGTDNPLIGYPLAYQYLTSLRPDALPATADDLLNMRGRGWRATYPLGSSAPAQGLPLMTASRWDTGAQVRLGWAPVDFAVAITNGTLSNPRVQDDNGGKQVSGRITVRPSAGLLVGLSAAHGAFLSRRVTDALAEQGDPERFSQRAVGADLEYSQDHWVIRAEALVSSWRLPAVAAPFIRDPLRAYATSIEGRYKVRPAVYLAGRVDHLTFSRISGTVSGGQPIRWDAPVSRLELGGGYYLRRNVVAKAVYQHNWRDGGFRRNLGFVAGQLLYWF